MKDKQKIELDFNEDEFNENKFVDFMFNKVKLEIEKNNGRRLD